MAAIFSPPRCVNNPPGSETGIFQENKVNTIVADCLTLSLHRQIIISHGNDHPHLNESFFHKGGFQYWETIENTNIFLDIEK